MTRSLQSNAAGKTGIQIHDRKGNPTAHTHTKEDKKDREGERERANKKSPPEVIYYIV